MVLRTGIPGRGGTAPGAVRSKAIEALCEVDKGRFGDDVIGSTFDRIDFPNPSDYPLFTELVMGVLRNRLLIDTILEKQVKKPLVRSDHFTVNALRVGAYQLLFLSRVPDHAAVNETVACVKGRGSVPFVNAVLRNIQRKYSGESLETVRGREGLSVGYSVPHWLVEELGRYIPSERMESVISCLSGKPPLHVRVNELAWEKEEVLASLKEEGVEYRDHPLVEGCITLKGGPPLARMRAFLEGMVTPQDAGSLSVAKAVAEIVIKEKGNVGRILDTCAAPGVKTSYLRQALPSWDIVAADVSGKRLRDLRGNFRRLKATDVEIRQVDFTGEVPCELMDSFDTVFIDAPCSGLGVMRRNPEVKWRVKRGEVERFARKAGKIVEGGISCLKRGGICFYSTCTFTETENQAVIEEVSGTIGCHLRPIEEILPGLPGELYWREYLVTPPDVLCSDFFFLAAFTRK